MIHNIDLEYVPRDWQKQIHADIGSKRFCLCISHRRSGKTVVARMELIHRALSTPKFEGAYIAPFLVQARRVFWGQLKETANKIPGVEIKETDMLISFPNKSTIRCLGADSADGIRGLGFDYVAGDEMADWDPDVLQQVVMPTLAGRNGGLLLIGTPKGIDPLSMMFDNIKKDEDWVRFLFTVEDTKVFTDKELAVMKSNMRPRLYALEYMCAFDAGTPDTLISGEEVENAISRSIPTYDYSDAPMVLGVDVARYGDDRTVLIRRQGAKLYEPRIMRQASTIEIAKAIQMEVVAHDVDAVFMDYSAGLGGGVEDQAKVLGLDVICVHFNGSPRSDRFANCRVEMWFEMTQWLVSTGSIPDMIGFKQEVSTPTYKLNDTHKIQLEAKSDMKKRGMPSPDIADAVALTFYCPVQKKFKVMQDIKNYKPVDWDPLS
jgi:hypothetical protein